MARDEEWEFVDYVQPPEPVFEWGEEDETASAHSQSLRGFDLNALVRGAKQGRHAVPRPRAPKRPRLKTASQMLGRAYRRRKVIVGLPPLA